MLEAQKTCRRQGKHSVRLYTGRTRRAEPGIPLVSAAASVGAGRSPPASSAPQGGSFKGKVKGVMQKKRKERKDLKRKTAILTARLTPAEKAAIERKAKQAHMTVTDYIVKCALGKNVLPIQGLDDILSELKAQGRNLNQLTKLANMGRITVVNPENLEKAYTSLYELMEQIFWEGS